MNKNACSHNTFINLSYKFLFAMLISFGLSISYADTNDNSLFTTPQTSSAIPAFEVVPFARPNVVNFHIQSEILGQAMLVEIMLPLSYNPGDTNSYPVVYTTDSLVNFPLIASNNLLQGLSYDPPLPEVITVGVDFIEIDSVRDFKRLDYYTPVQDADEDFGVVGGKADQYISFLRYELKPFINTLFKTDTQQEIFSGHSLGGLLSLYTLFTQAEAFDEYIAASPAIYWADEVIFNYEHYYFNTDPVSEKNLFISVGTAEDPYGITLDYVKRMAKKIRRRHYDNLNFKFKKFRGENHTSVIAPAYAKGVRFVFEAGEAED